MAGDDDSQPSSNSKATSRLNQIKSHVAKPADPPPKRSSLSSTDLSSSDIPSNAPSSSAKPSAPDSEHSPDAVGSSSSNDTQSTSSRSTTPEQNQTTNSSSSTGGRRRRRKDSSDAPPADYSDILGQIRTLQQLARTPSAEHRGYARQKAAGKLWVRERVDRLFDEGSVHEVGSISGEVDWAPKERKDGSIEEQVKSFTPSNNVQGFGTLNGRKCCFTADDYSLRAGHADGALWSKTIYLEKLALHLKLPIIKLVDGSSGGGSVTTIKKTGYSYVPPLTAFDAVVKQLNAGIPNLGAVLGPAIGIGAARVVSCHFSVMAADIGSLFNAGPSVVAGATFEEGLSFTELGGPDMHCRNGTIDNLAADEEDAFRQLRTVLTYLPNSGTSLPPSLPPSDEPSRTDDWLRTAIPRSKARMYNPRKIISTVVDKNSFFEIGALWGTTAIVGLARLAGHPVGIVANNCESGAGALDAAGSHKITRHLRFCDVFNLPLLQFVDIPGYAIGTIAERTATMRKGVELVMAYCGTTMPMFSVILRRVYGVAGGAMLDCRDPIVRVAWPSGDWGSLPLQGGIEVGHSHELKQARAHGEEEEEERQKREGTSSSTSSDTSGNSESSPEELKKQAGQKAYDALYAELERDYNRLMNPVRTANAFGVEEIIDPATTRPVACAWAQHVYAELLPQRVKMREAGTLNVTYG